MDVITSYSIHYTKLYDFYRKVVEDLQNLKLAEQDTCLVNSSGIIAENFKGIPTPVEYRILA